MKICVKGGTASRSRISSSLWASLALQRVLGWQESTQRARDLQLSETELGIQEANRQCYREINFKSIQSRRPWKGYSVRGDMAREEGSKRKEHTNHARAHRYLT